MRKIYLSLCALSLVFLAGCEKEVFLDVKYKEPKVVIQGNFPVGGFALIDIKKTVQLNEKGVYPTIDDAVVKISDGTTTETLTLETSGKYKTVAMKAEEGKTYTLTVVAEGKTYKSKQTAPKRVPFSGLRVDWVQNPFFPSEKTLQPFPLYHDPVEEKNFYKFNFYVAERGRAEQIDVFSDVNFNGQTRDRHMEVYSDDIQSGNKVRVEMCCITEDVCQYYFELEMSQNPMIKSPANPTSNISGGALGYFSVYTIESLDVVAP